MLETYIWPNNASPRHPSVRKCSLLETYVITPPSKHNLQKMKNLIPPLSLVYTIQPMLSNVIILMKFCQKENFKIQKKVKLKIQPILSNAIISMKFRQKEIFKIQKISKFENLKLPKVRGKKKRKGT